MPITQEYKFVRSRTLSYDVPSVDLTMAIVNKYQIQVALEF